MGKLAEWDDGFPINMDQEDVGETKDLNILTDAMDSIKKTPWELTNLKPKHKQVAALIAQGMKNVDIARLVGITPEYVTMLLRQPVFRSYVAEMCEIVGTRLEALFAQSVDVIAETMQSGTPNEKLKAARLQLEATKRIGRPDPSAGLNIGATDRLDMLANRLLELQSRVRTGGVFNENGQEITDA